LWTGAFLLPFLLAAASLLFPFTQRLAVNYLLNVAFPGASVAAVHLHLRGFDLSDIRLPTTGGRVEIENILVSSNWRRLLWTHQFNASQIYLRQIHFLPDSTLPGFGPSLPFDLLIIGGEQEHHASSRSYEGVWRIQAAPRIFLPGPASSAPLDGGLFVSANDPTVPGPQPFAEAEFDATLDPAFLWNLDSILTATHDQFAQALTLFLRDDEKYAAALRIIDSPGQHWKIHVTFNTLPGGGCTWAAHATLWGDRDLAADLAAVNLLARGANGAPITDAAGLQQGPTITIDGINSQPTSTDFTDILMRMQR
jgi:hypothetical protein